jgi:mono/diheme cytochrome c family protein
LTLGLWAAARAVAADSAAVEHGKAVFQYWCAPCHGPGNGMFGPGPGGNGLPGAMALALKYKGTKPALLEARTDLDPALIREVVRHGIVAMPFFRKTEISSVELDAIVAYLTRNNP